MALLGVQPGAVVDRAWLRRRRRLLALAFHPDHHPAGGDRAALQAVLTATAAIESSPDHRAPEVYRVEATALGARVVLE